ncbi:cupin domain-containing protein [Pseudomonas matsuisoli]|uniref:Cupin n=1 Tax=Pseudomonas matsuisoli TaxID=1515666 RepID=A0A917PV55_9PSED|nr:cupin domain-containing protein [Pseudomonas matsuisoli]GGJ93266.1 cupin [Pseudomonas matsuisoli]
MLPILHFSRPASDRQLPATLPFSLRHDPLPAGRQFHLHDLQRGYAVGTARSVTANHRIEAFPWVELSLVEAGTLHVEGDDFALSAGPGEVLIVPRGSNVRWRHDGELRRIFMVFNGQAAERPMPAQPVKIDPAATLEPCNPPAASVLLTDTPTAHSNTQFKSGGCLRIGLWECTPYARKQVEPDYTELMVFYEGAVGFDTPTGGRFDVAAGEAILIPAGATNAWRNDVTVKKLFCILS